MMEAYTNRRAFLRTIAIFLLFLSSAVLLNAGPIQDLMSDDKEVRKKAAQQILELKDLRYVPSLVEVAFYWTLKRNRSNVDEISEVLRKLTEDQKPQKYFDWVQWVGKRPEIKPFPHYVTQKRSVLSLIDPALAAFLEMEDSIRIRPEEIVWGGVRKDGIPALVNPPNLPASKASYLKDSDSVFGIVLGGEARAYPLRIMDWHEMANDVIAGVPVSIPYCTLCGSAIAYNPKVGETTYTFGSSGLLYRSNKLMYDHNTESLWSALSGEPVAGKLVDRNIKLEILPIVRTTWGDWKRRHPDTTVLDVRTGHDRDYSKQPYKEYFESDQTMFPVPEEDPRVPSKEFVFALRTGKIRKAYPLNVLKEKPFLTDNVGDTQVVLITEAEQKSVRAYKCEGMQAKASWKAEEKFLVSPDGDAKCPRLGGHLAYWFGWFAQFPDTDLYGE